MHFLVPVVGTIGNALKFLPFEDGRRYTPGTLSDLHLVKD